MLNIGSSEFLLLGALFFFLFGPDKARELYHSFIQAYRAFRQHSQSVTDELRRQLEFETEARSQAKTAPAVYDPAPLASQPMKPVSAAATLESPEAPLQSGLAAPEEAHHAPPADLPDAGKVSAHSLGDGSSLASVNEK